MLNERKNPIFDVIQMTHFLNGGEEITNVFFNYIKIIS